MKNQKTKMGRRQRTMYIAIDRGVQVAARQRAIGEGKTLGALVEEALRKFLYEPGDAITRPVSGPSGEEG